MMPRRLLSWLFALTLLFGQAAAFAHALTHLHAADSALPEQTCEVCVGQAQLGSAVPLSLVVQPIAPGTRPPILADTPPRVDLAPRPARARAPPAAVHI